MPTAPDDLGRMVTLILGYGAVCVAFGAVLGYVVLPSMVRSFRSLLRRL